MLKRIAVLLFLFPAVVLAEDQVVTPTVQASFDPERMCIYASKVYSLGDVIHAAGINQKCVYNSGQIEGLPKGAVWRQSDE
jgi:hypothetical protein